MYEYDLFAVINHEGQIDNGHYTNFARFQDEVGSTVIVLSGGLTRYIEQWYRFDDDKWGSLSPSEACSSHVLTTQPITESHFQACSHASIHRHICASTSSGI